MRTKEPKPKLEIELKVERRREKETIFDNNQGRRDRKFDTQMSGTSMGGSRQN
jgi:hypothetical protein